MNNKRFLAILTVIVIMTVMAFSAVNAAAIDNSAFPIATNIPDGDVNSPMTDKSTGGATDKQTGVLDSAMDKASGALDSVKDDVDDAVDDVKGSGMMGIVIAILVAIALIVLIIIMVSKNKTNYNRK